MDKQRDCSWHVLSHTQGRDEVSPDLRRLEQEEEDAEELDDDGFGRILYDFCVHLANLSENVVIV